MIFTSIRLLDNDKPLDNPNNNNPLKPLNTIVM